MWLLKLPFNAAGIMGSDFRKQTESQIPLGRIAQVLDIARAAMFLTSAETAQITAESLLIAG